MITQPALQNAHRDSPAVVGPEMEARKIAGADLRTTKSIRGAVVLLSLSTFDHRLNGVELHRYQNVACTNILKYAPEVMKLRNPESGFVWNCIQSEDVGLQRRDWSGTFRPVLGQYAVICEPWERSLIMDCESGHQVDLTGMTREDLGELYVAANKRIVTLNLGQSIYKTKRSADLEARIERLKALIEATKTERNPALLKETRRIPPLPNVG